VFVLIPLATVTVLSYLQALLPLSTAIHDMFDSWPITYLLTYNVSVPTDGSVRNFTACEKSLTVSNPKYHSVWVVPKIRPGPTALNRPVAIQN